jgi:hypothetical protein
VAPKTVTFTLAGWLLVASGTTGRRWQQRAAWLETNAELVAQRRAVMQELGWRHRADAWAIELDPPVDLVAAFGPMPTERRAQAAWRAAVSQVDGYRRAWGIERPGWRSMKSAASERRNARNMLVRHRSRITRPARPVGTAGPSGGRLAPRRAR